MLIHPVDITMEAYNAIKDIMAKKTIPEDYGLRIFVADSGISCGATNYALGFDKETDRDIVYKIEDLNIIIKKVEAVHLAGLKLNYTKDEEVAGFSFDREA